MDAALSMQVLSASVADMIKKAIEGDSISVGNIQNKQILTLLMHFIEKWNRLVDIMNGRDGKYYTPENGREIQRVLLKHLTWLTKWKISHNEGVKKGEQTEWNFFADETWRCIQLLILSHVCIIEHYCVKRGFKIHPCRLNTDPVEKHFCNGRQMVGGSRTGMTESQWINADTAATLAVEANFAAVGNNSNAGNFTQYRQKN